MRWINVVLAALIATLAAYANPDAESKFSYDPTRFQVAQAMSQPEEQPAPDVGIGMETESKLIPGKALLLSAILPGAGQYYARNPLMAAAFLAIEVGAWAGVAIYHAEGQDKEDEYMNFAEQYWTYYDPTGGDFGSYLSYEYWAATLFGNDGESGGTDGYTGGIDEWQNEPWNEKLKYLPSDGFTHELDPDEKDQQYYEMIGKYNQFAPGWPDYDESYHEINPEDWKTNPAITPLRNKYLDLRKKSNDALNMSKDFTMVVLANHLISALHAGFSVSMYNRKLAKEQKIEGAFRLEPKKINNERVTMGVLRITF